ncbi:MAG TPA: bifunctional phosphopantothenoylcysteine decarboxylase/phosphopantothenate--cysteine ligase CoaBC [Acidimicrobiia bacterium]|nr:bifunctional phosphopantothenoylcysteine decarboxylase/phosphopantothenate--cysteine ligase CoaBC [Acidimicrobiia bacterium]
MTDPAAPLVTLRGRRVVLGVTGGIAAYKAVEVCRRLVDAGSHVAPVLTEDALRFVGALTFSALASEPARTSLFEGSDPIPHTHLGQSADLVVVAPATAKLLGKYAAGISDDLLTATLLATRAPVLVAPAMHTEMWEHPAVQENLATLRRRGVHVVDPEAGRLAGGDEGEGRLADPARIVRAAAVVLAVGDLAGVRVLVTAGGTREPLDPVRFVGNRSSGKMGHAVADAAASRGAAVTLVTTADRPAADVVEVVRVETADEMADAVLGRFAEVDVVVMAAAVADFRPKATTTQKLKKQDGVPEVVLEPTPDILAALGERKQSHQVLVGFAAETEHVQEQAAGKLTAKRVDLMVANDVSAPDAGFEVDTNRAILLYSSGSAEETPLVPKAELAGLILDRVVERLRQTGA